MKALRAFLRRYVAQWRLACLQAAYNADQEEFCLLCDRLSRHRRGIAAAQLELDQLDGRHQQSVHQLRAR